MKEKITMYLWRGSFLLLILVPGIISIFHKDIKSNATEENRVLAKKPQFTLDNYLNYSQEYTNWYDDHLPFRQKLVQLNSLLSYELFSSSTSENVIVGKDGWFFYTNEEAGDPLKDYKGMLEYDSASIERMTEYLENVQEEMNRHEVEFVVLIPPNKESVYDEYMPDYIRKNGKAAQTDAFVEYLQDNSSINVVYPKEEMLQYKDEYQLFFKQDTHWNLLGAFIGEQQILDVLYGERSSLEGEKIVDKELVVRPSAEKDLARMMNLQDYFSDIEYSVEGYDDFDSWDSTYLQNETPAHNDKVLFVGDSFRRSLKPYLNSDFSQVYIVTREEYTHDMLEKFKPDIVVLECVERYSGNIADMDW